MACPFLAGEMDASTEGAAAAAAAGGCPFGGGGTSDPLTKEQGDAKAAAKGREPVYYHKYLQLDKVLEAQTCLSSTKAEEVVPSATVRHSS